MEEKKMKDKFVWKFELIEKSDMLKELSDTKNVFMNGWVIADTFNEAYTKVQQIIEDIKDRTIIKETEEDTIVLETLSLRCLNSAVE